MKTIELQINNFKQRIINWLDLSEDKRNRDNAIDVNECAIATQIINNYLNLKGELYNSIEKIEDASIEFDFAVQEIVRLFLKRPKSQKNIVYLIFSYASGENLVCHWKLLDLIFPNLNGELHIASIIEYYIEMNDGK